MHQELASATSNTANPTAPTENIHFLTTTQFITHTPKSGFNPLVDAAAYIFSIIGKLTTLPAYRQLQKLHDELTEALNAFQDSAKAQGYTSEYMLVSRYALAATLDDIIMHTPWGAHGQWDPYSLLTELNHDVPQHNQQRFFAILDRIIKEPALYIDVMELMYFCLSLGFKGQYRATEFNHLQLEQITHALYRRIRSVRGDFNKTLSPFPIKLPAPPKPKPKKLSLWMLVLATLGTVLVLFIGLGQMLDTISNQAYQELMHIGKSILYDENSAPKN